VNKAKVNKSDETVGMVQVTKDQFYGVIYQQRLDVFPRSRVEAGEYPWPTDWNFRSGALFGIDYPTDIRDEDEYWMLRAYAPSAALVG
jgi:hypothetical protein